MALLMTVSGCQEDESYDLENMDTEITVLKGVEVPLPDFQEIKLKDLISVDTSSDIFSVNANGEYVISYTMDPVNFEGFTLNASDFVLDASDSQTKNIDLSTTTIQDNTPVTSDATLIEKLEGLSLPIFDGLNVDQFKQLLDQSYNYNFDVDFTIAGFPDEVKAFRNCDLSGNLDLSFLPSGAPFDYLIFKQGTEFTFPAYLKIASCTNASFQVLENHILKSTEDILVYLPGNSENKTAGLDMSLVLSGIDMGANGVATNGSLPMNAQISISGHIGLNPEAFNGPTKSVDIYYDAAPHTIVLVDGDQELGEFSATFSYATNNVNLENVVIRVDASKVQPDFGQDMGIDIEGLPDMLTDGSADVNVELSEIQVLIDLNSNMPLAFSLSASMRALDANSAPTHSYPIGPLNFPAYTRTAYSLGEHASGAGDGFTYVNVAGLGKILSPVPARIEVGSYSFNIDDSSWLSLAIGQTYNGSCNVSLEAPLAFTAATRVQLSVDLENLSLDMGDDVEISKAVLNLTAKNTIPLAFELEAVALDGGGNPIPEVTTSVDKPIAGGSLENPANTDITITLNMARPVAVKGIKLNLKASSNDSIAGIHLNENQGITITNVSMGIPNGITTDIGKKDNK